MKNYVEFRGTKYYFSTTGFMHIARVLGRM